MRQSVLVVASVFAVALAYVVGSRLSSEALAVLVGVVCGIGATLPVSVGVVIAWSRRWGREEREEPTASAPAYGRQPPVIVISPPQVPYAYGQQPFYLPPGAPAPGTPREFKIIGDE